MFKNPIVNLFIYLFIYFIFPLGFWSMNFFLIEPFREKLPTCTFFVHTVYTCICYEQRHENKTTIRFSNRADTNRAVHTQKARD